MEQGFADGTLPTLPGAQQLSVWVQRHTVAPHLSRKASERPWALTLSEDSHMPLSNALLGFGKNDLYSPIKGQWQLRGVAVSAHCDETGGRQKGREFGLSTSWSSSMECRRLAASINMFPPRVISNLIRDKRDACPLWVLNV